VLGIPHYSYRHRHYKHREARYGHRAYYR
jgi:hypothetical protein